MYIYRHNSPRQRKQFLGHPEGKALKKGLQAAREQAPVELQTEHACDSAENGYIDTWMDRYIDG